MHRKSSKNTRGPNADEKAFQAWLKTQPCFITGQNNVQVHHCMGATFKHNKELIGHFFCLPLSEEKHKEYHAGTKAWRENYGTQSSWWMLQMMNYAMETGKGCPESVFDAIKDYGL